MANKPSAPCSKARRNPRIARGSAQFYAIFQGKAIKDNAVGLCTRIGSPEIQTKKGIEKKNTYFTDLKGTENVNR